MELIIWFIVMVLVALLALVESVRFSPNPLSQAELERRAANGDTGAKHELTKRSLLPLYYGLQRIKITILIVALFGVLASTYALWLTLIIGLILMLLAGVVVAMGWLAPVANWLQPKIEKHVWKIVKSMTPALKLFAPRISGGGEISFASKDELKQMIDHDAAVLATDEKARLVAAMHFNAKTVVDVMVPADKIATVGQSETVGPLLLDKLHKAGHNIIVVVGKSLDNVKGLLYMSDLVPLDPEIKTVKDALRPKVVYISADAPVSEVIGASVKTGRQLFLVAKQGKVVGLVTLADVLEHLIGERLSKDARVGSRPEEL